MSQAKKPQKDLSSNSTLKFQFAGAFSIGRSKRYDENIKNNNPGPNQYNQQIPDILKKVHIPSWKMSTSPKNVIKINNENVGPCNYDLPSDFDYQKSKSKGVSFGKVNEIKQTKEEKLLTNLGPGLYDINTKQKFKEIKYTFSSKYVPKYELTSMITPGPGQYTKDQTIENNKSNYNLNKTSKSVNSVVSKGTFGATNRTSLQKIQETPGVGQYQVFHKQEPILEQKSTFSKAQRFKSKVAKSYENIIGPNSYIPLSSFDKLKTDNKRFTLGQKLSNGYLNIDNKIPGVGQYNDQNKFIKKNYSTVSFPVAQRDLNKKKEETPGPGEYQTVLKENKYYQQNYERENKSLTNKQNKQAQIIQNKKEVEQTPGPGAYFQQYEEQLEEYKKKIANTGTIKSPQNSNKWTKSFKSPGPGQYQIQPKSSGAKLTFGKRLGSNSSFISSNGTLGPGAYNISRDILSDSHGPLIKKESQYSKTIKKQESPAPGQYEIKNTIAGMPDYMLNSLNKQPQNNEKKQQKINNN